MPRIILTNLDDRFPQVGQDTSGSDTIFGRAGNDDINAGEGANKVYGGAGNDHVFVLDPNHLGMAQAFYGQGGNDWLGSGAGDDLLDGGAGNDALTDNGGGENTLYGGIGDDTLSFYDFNFADRPNNYGYGGDGNDSLNVLASGTVQMFGGTGDDKVSSYLAATVDGPSGFYGGDGVDHLNLQMAGGGSGMPPAPLDLQMVQTGDVIGFQFDGVKVAEFSGFESISVEVIATHATLFGGGGDDSVTLGERFNAIDLSGQVSTGGGDDVVTSYGASGALTLDGGAGTDTLVLDYSLQLTEVAQDVTVDLQGPSGTFSLGDVHSTATGFEVLNFAGGDGNDAARGGAGNDTIGGFYDVLGKSGDRDYGTDGYDGGAGNDVLYGGFGVDTLTGGDGNDKLEGGEAGDRIYGGAGNDILAGDSLEFHRTPGGNDLLYGGNGNDVITGGIGADTMAGGNGVDRFVFEQISDSGVLTDQVDNINFFTVVKSHAGHIDQIDLSAIDANLAVKGNSAFSFVGSHAFTAAGQVRVEEKGGSAYVQVNNGGTLAADMMICLVKFNAAHLGAEDFIL